MDEALALASCASSVVEACVIGSDLGYNIDFLCVGLCCYQRMFSLILVDLLHGRLRRHLSRVEDRAGRQSLLVVQGKHGCFVAIRSLIVYGRCCKGVCSIGQS